MTLVFRLSLNFLNCQQTHHPVSRCEEQTSRLHGNNNNNNSNGQQTLLLSQTILETKYLKSVGLFRLLKLSLRPPETRTGSVFQHLFLLSGPRPFTVSGQNFFSSCLSVTDSVSTGVKGVDHLTFFVPFIHLTPLKPQ